MNTIFFCGSSTVKNPEDHLTAVTKAIKDEKNGGAKDMARLTKQQPLLKYHQVARDLSRRLTAWSMHRSAEGKSAYHVATGGGTGLVEAANEGAWEAGGKSLGLSDNGGFNKYMTPELTFSFHYFFTKKFWMAYKCMGVVALPGGFGTCDELFEILTLMQTGKIKRKMPVVLVGKDYWLSSIRWKKMAEYGMISDQDVDQLLFTDSAVEAFEYIVKFWEGLEASGSAQALASPKHKRAIKEHRTGG